MLASAGGVKSDKKKLLVLDKNWEEEEKNLAIQENVTN